MMNQNKSNCQNLFTRCSCFFSFHTYINIGLCLLVFIVLLKKCLNAYYQQEFIICPEQLIEIKSILLSSFSLQIFVTLLIFTYDNTIKAKRNEDFYFEFLKLLFGTRIYLDKIVTYFMYIIICGIVMFSFFTIIVDLNTKTLVDYKAEFKIVVKLISSFIAIVFFLVEILIFEVKTRFIPTQLRRKVLSLIGTKNLIKQEQVDESFIDEIMDLINRVKEPNDAGELIIVILNIFFYYDNKNKYIIFEKLINKLFRIVKEIYNDKQEIMAQNALFLFEKAFDSIDDNNLILLFIFIKRYIEDFDAEEIMLLEKNSNLSNMFYLLIPYAYMSNPMLYKKVFQNII